MRLVCVRGLLLAGQSTSLSLHLIWVETQEIRLQVHMKEMRSFHKIAGVILNDQVIMGEFWIRAAAPLNWVETAVEVWISLRIRLTSDWLFRHVPLDREPKSGLNVDVWRAPRSGWNVCRYIKLSVLTSSVYCHPVAFQEQKWPRNMRVM